MAISASFGSANKPKLKYKGLPAQLTMEHESFVSLRVNKNDALDIAGDISYLAKTG